MDSPLKRALEVFETTRFAFIPILAKKEERLEDEEGSSLIVVRQHHLQYEIFYR